MARKFFGFARASPRARLGAFQRNRSVRFSPEPPRAPRVRSGFGQGLIIHREYQNSKHVFEFCCISRESKGFEKVASYFVKIATT